jgi:hypothetical protein
MVPEIGRRVNVKRFVVVAVLLFCAAAGWSVGQRLSSDALSMAIGVVFGILAGIPAALLVMAATRRGERPSEIPKRMDLTHSSAGYQPPVIVVSPPMGGYASGYANGYGQGGPKEVHGYLPATPSFVDGQVRREFRVVGSEEEWEDD